MSFAIGPGGLPRQIGTTMPPPNAPRRVLRKETPQKAFRGPSARICMGGRRPGVERGRTAAHEHMDCTLEGALVDRRAGAKTHLERNEQGVAAHDAKCDRRATKQDNVEDHGEESLLRGKLRHLFDGPKGRDEKRDYRGHRTVPARRVRPRVGHDSHSVCLDDTRRQIDNKMKFARQ